MPASTYSSTSSPLPEPHLVKTRASKGKSRSGCVTCKKRKVKCDERRPGCLNCSRRSQGCVYSIKTLPKWRERTGTFVVKDLRVKESPPARKDDEDVVDEVEVRSDESLDIVDMDGERAYGNGVVLPTTLSCVSSDFGQTFGIEDFYLLTQFESLTDLDMLNYYELEVNDVIQLGFNNEFLLHSMLALVARHLDHSHQSSSPTTNSPSNLKTLELHHLQHTLSKFHPALTPSRHTNHHALLATSFLLSIYSCSSAARTPFDPVSCADASFTHLHGVRAIIVHHLNRPRGGLFRSVLTPPKWLYTFTQNFSPEDGPGARFIALLETLDEKSPYYQNKEIYIERMSSLTPYLLTCASPSHMDAIAQETLEVITLCCIAWQACCPSEFVELVRKGDEIALMVLAHYYVAAGCVHGRLRKGWWWWRDGPRGMVRGILGWLGSEWWEWVEWIREMEGRF